MKKLKILLPIIASTGIMPMTMVSCGTKFDYVTWTKGETFTPTVGKYKAKEGEIETLEEAGYVLGREMKKNPKILAESFIQSVYESREQEPEKGIKSVSCAITFINQMPRWPAQFEAHIALKLSGDFVLEVFGCPKTITFDNSFIWIKGNLMILRYDSDQDHPFYFNDSHLTPEYVSMPRCKLSDGKIVVEKENTIYNNGTISEDTLTFSIAEGICEMVGSSRVPYFDDVVIEDR